MSPMVACGLDHTEMMPGYLPDNQGAPVSTISRPQYLGWKRKQPL